MRKNCHNAIITQREIALFDSAFIRELDAEWRKICEEHNAGLLSYEKARQASKHAFVATARHEVEIRGAGAEELGKTYREWEASAPGRFARLKAKAEWAKRKNVAREKWVAELALLKSARQRLKSAEEYRDSAPFIMSGPLMTMNENALSEAVDMARFCFTIGVRQGSGLWDAIVRAVKRVEARENSVDSQTEAA